MGRCKKYFMHIYQKKEKKMDNSPKVYTDQYKEWQQLFWEHQSHWAARMPPLLLHNRFLIHGPAVGRIQDWIMSQYTFYPTLFLYVVSSFSIWSQRLSKNTQIFFMFCPCVVTQQRIDRGKQLSYLERLRLTNTVLNWTAERDWLETWAW